MFTNFDDNRWLISSVIFSWDEECDVMLFSCFLFRWIENFEKNLIFTKFSIQRNRNFKTDKLKLEQHQQFFFSLFKNGWRYFVEFKESDSTKTLTMIFFLEKWHFCLFQCSKWGLYFLRNHETKTNSSFQST